MAGSSVGEEEDEEDEEERKAKCDRNRISAAKPGNSKSVIRCAAMRRALGGPRVCVLLLMGRVRCRSGSLRAALVLVEDAVGVMSL